MSKLSKLNPHRIPPYDGVQLAAQLVAKILPKVKLHKALLFGSAATNEHTDESDLDILIVVEHKSQIQQVYKIVQSPYFSPVAVDWIVKTLEDFDGHKKIGGVCFIAQNYGKDLLTK